MLVYITKNNFSKIVRKIPVKGLILEGDLYVRYNVNLNAIFSSFEKSELLLYKMLSEDPDKFLNEVYTQITEREDTYTWVYEEKKKPCYHGKPNCPRLHSDFENYQVPLPIKYKGIEKDILLDRLKISDLTEGELLSAAHSNTLRRAYNQFDTTHNMVDNVDVMKASLASRTRKDIIGSVSTPNYKMRDTLINIYSHVSKS